MKNIYAILFLLVCLSTNSFAQTSLTSDNFGTTAQNPIARTGWTANIAGGSNWELRTTGASSVYSWTNPAFSASGGANVFTNLGTNNNTKTLTYDNSLSTVGYTNITVRVGGLKSGTVPNIDVSYSTDGTTYTSAGTITLTTAWAAYSVILPSGAEGVTNLRIRFSVTANSSATNFLRFDDFQVIGTTASCTAPSQASGLSTNTPTADGFSAAWTAGSGSSGTMIVVRRTADANALPASGTAYTPNLAWASAGQINANNRVVYRSNGTTAGPVTGLTAETQYTVTAYAYNATGECYQLTSPPSTTIYTLSTEPTAHATTFSNTVVAYNQIDLSYTVPGSGADGYVILRRDDGIAPTTTGIVDGVAPGSWSLPSGTVVANANATGTSWSNTGLSGSTNYCYLLIPFNWNGLVAATYNYRTTATVPSTCGTTPAAPSITSDIVLSSMAYTSNIDYTAYQATGPFTNTSGNVGVMGITIRDGGTSSPDGDALPTILTGITFSGITGTSMIRAAGLFEGNALVAGSGTINTGANTISFTGLNYSCSDNGTRDLTLRVSFLTTVTDNLQMVFNVTNANVTTASGSTSSQMSAFTTVTSSTTGDTNRIEVTATKLVFQQQPTTTGINVTMSPSPTVRALDVNNNLDLDYVTNVSISSTGTMTGDPLSVTPVAGVATLNSVVHTVLGTGLTLSATSGGLTNATSTTFNIISDPSVDGDYEVLSSGTWLSNSATTPPQWRRKVSGVWTNNNSAVYSSTNTIYIRTGVTLTTGGSFGNTVNIVIENGAVFNVNHQSTTGSIIVKNGGTLNVNAALTNNGTFEIEAGGTCNYAYNSGAATTLTTTMWNGTENFRPGSYFIIKELPDPSNFFFVNSNTEVTANTYSGYSAMFGYLIVDMTASDNTQSFSLFNTGITNNLSHNDFIWRTAAPGVATYRVSSTGTINMGIKHDMIVETTWTGSTINNTTSGNVTLNIGANLKHESTVALRVCSGSSTFSGTFNIDSTLYVTGGGTLSLNSTSTSNPAKATINLKGDLIVGSTSKLNNLNTTTLTDNNLNFIGTTLQKINAASSVDGVQMNTKMNSSVQLYDNNLTLNNGAHLTIDTLSTFDFNWDLDGVTPLIVNQPGTPSGSNKFTTKQQSTIIITSPNGLYQNWDVVGAVDISGNPVTVNVGNVQGIPKTNRSINTLVTFWFKGKGTLNYTGDCVNPSLSTAGNAKVVICDLPGNHLVLTPTVSFGVTDATTISSTGGKLDVRKGQFVETETAYIFGTTGTLYMAPGTLYKVLKGNSAYTDLDDIPRMYSTTYSYVLTGGTIELAGTGTNHQYQRLRSDNAFFNYVNVKYSGSNATGTYKNLSQATYIDSALYITGTPIVDCFTGAAGSAASFLGNGGLIMDDGLLRIRKRTDPNPELEGIAMPYTITGGTIEFYGTNAGGGTQQIRGNYGSPTKVVNYYNLEINADEARLNTANPGNVDLSSSIVLQGTLNVNSPAILRLDETDFIYKHHVTSSSLVNINSGSGLFYGSPFGITTVGTGGIGLDPTRGPANPSAGSIRTSTRNFNSSAIYGFIGNGNMVSGDGIPSSVAGLYSFKTTSADVTTLSKSVLDNGVLGLHNGKILSSSTNKLTLETTASIENSPTNAGGIANMGHENSYVIGVMGRNTNASGSEKVFPIGSATLYGPLAISPASATAQTYSCEYFSTGFGDYDIDAADVPMLNHVSVVEYWTVASTASGANDNANVKLFWRDHTIVSGTSGDWADLRVAHHDGTDWNDEGNNATSGVSTSWGYVQSNVIPNFSPITFGSLIPDNPLPVELITFVASCDNGIVNIHWATASEVNNDYFVLEKSSDGENFTQLAVKDGYNTTNITHHYFETDNNPYDGTTYYRLKQVDNNGEVSYSKIIKSDCFNGNDEFVNIFYAPGEGITATSYMNEDEDFNFKIYNDIGQVLFDFNKDLVVGFTRNLLNNADLATGTYFVTAESDERRVSVKLFVP